MTYKEKLKDPRWQKKRLEIFDRDGWKCVECGDKDSTLNVHHIFYLSGLDKNSPKKARPLDGFLWFTFP